MNQVHLLQEEVERLNSEKQQGSESLAGDIASALISSDDSSIENEWLTPVVTRATETRDLLAVINANIADFSRATEK